MLNIQNYTKRFGDKIAVDDLSLHIAAGEICAFIGHNGAGKTTTLKACCGLLKPDGGTITVNGIDIQKDPIACKKIMAYIPDNPDLYEFLTGYEYLNFVADMYGVSEADRKARMEALAARRWVLPRLGARFCCKKSNTSYPADKIEHKCSDFRCYGQKVLLCKIQF